MSGERKAIRKAVAAQLLGVAPAYRTDAEDRVFASRRAPYKKLELPAIAVYTQEDVVDTETQWTAPRELKRTLQVIIEAVVEESDDVDDAIDDIAGQIEDAMDLDIYLGGTASNSVLSRTDSNATLVGERPAGLARLTYEVNYYSRPSGQLELFDFLRVDAKTSLGGVQAPADQTEQQFEVTQ